MQYMHHTSGGLTLPLLAVERQLEKVSAFHALFGYSYRVSEQIIRNHEVPRMCGTTRLCCGMVVLMIV